MQSPHKEHPSLQKHFKKHSSPRSRVSWHARCGLRTQSGAWGSDVSHDRFFLHYWVCLVISTRSPVAYYKHLPRTACFRCSFGSDWSHKCQGKLKYVSDICSLSKNTFDYKVCCKRMHSDLNIKQLISAHSMSIQNLLYVEKNPRLQCATGMWFAALESFSSEQSIFECMDNEGSISEKLKLTSSLFWHTSTSNYTQETGIKSS